MSECVNVDCGNNGYCISYDNGYHYKCKCNIGYAGVTCDYNVDDCLGSPCKNEASCVDGIDDYSCLCIHEGTGGTVFFNHIQIKFWHFHMMIIVFECLVTLTEIFCAKLTNYKLASICEFN